MPLRIAAMQKKLVPNAAARAKRKWIRLNILTTPSKFSVDTFSPNPKRKGLAAKDRTETRAPGGHPSLPMLPATSPSSTPSARGSSPRRAALLLTFLLGPCPPGLAQATNPYRGRSLARPLVPQVERLHPLASLKELVRHFEAKGQFQRAWEVLAFALAHDPNDLSMLRHAAWLHRRLGDPGLARVYAHRVLLRAPEDSRMKALLESLPAEPEASPSAPAPSPKEESKPDTEAEPTEPEPEALSHAQRLRLRVLLKTLQSAIKAYDLKHPKTPLESLELEKLVEDGLLPAGFQAPFLDEVEYADGSLSHTREGTLEALDEKWGRYAKELDEVADWLRKGYPYEARRQMRRIRESYGLTPEAKLLAVRIAQALPESRRQELEVYAATEDGPTLLLQSAVENWRKGRPDHAKTLLERLVREAPKSPLAPVAKHLLGLLGQGLDLEFLLDFYRQRRESLAASETTTTAEEAAEGEGEEAEESGP